MQQQWSEQSLLPRGAKVVFEGIDQEAKDQLDIENFARGAKAPSDEDPGGKAFAPTAGLRARAISPRDAMTVGLGLVFALVAYLVAGELEARSEVRNGVAVGGLVLGLSLLAVIDMVRRKKAAPLVRNINNTFTLSLGRSGFTWAGAGKPPREIDLAAIASFNGDLALTVRHTDGKTTTLPCRLPGRAHGPLAARLNELLAEVKADPS